MPPKKQDVQEPKNERESEEFRDISAEKEPVWKMLGREAYELIRIFVIALLIVIPIRLFVFQTFTVNGASMEPNFYNADYLIIDELSYHFRAPVRGEVVVFRYPVKPSEYFIKRIIGLPGETIEIKNGEVWIGGTDTNMKRLNESYLPTGRLTTGSERVTLKAGEYFVLGDNREASLDSRVFGPLEEKYITGKSMIRGWPFDRVAFFAPPEYYLGNK